MGFLFGFQLREKFIKRLNSKKMIEILLKGFFSIILVFFIAYFLSQNIYIAALITIFSTSISYFFLFKKDDNAVPVYIFNLLVIFLFIFVVENLYIPIKFVFLKLLLSFLSAYLIYLAIGKREKVEIYIILIGFLLLLSGIAKELSISNLTFSFFIGFIITNLKFPSKVKLEETMLKLETPLFSFLLFMMGLLITRPSTFYLIVIGIFGIAGLLIRGLLYGNFKFQIPISQISILFIVDFIGMFSGEFITSFIIIYLISNLLILVTGKKNDYKVS
jgi:hypothetical protein